MLPVQDTRAAAEGLSQTFTASSTMTSSNSELKKITAELKHLSFKRQQLLERKNIQCVFQELRTRAEFGRIEEAAAAQQEIDAIDEELKQMTERRAELQKSCDNILNAQKDMKTKQDDKKEVSFTPTEPAPASNIFYVDAPPTIPAPTVHLDLDKLPLHPCRTQCPECRQFITTETSTSVSSVTWLVCIMTALIGCVAGCCLIPFCLKRFKSTTHRCPNCRTAIQTVKRL